MAIVNSSKKRKGTSKEIFLQIKRGDIETRQGRIQYTLLSIRCFMHSDRMRTDAISQSMIQVLYCRAVSCCEMYCIGYSLFDNLVCITACLYMWVCCVALPCLFV